ncbi:hypothetical protein C6P40_001591 [Pichia californica]|uniref:VPS9 domain-containing protein n=1 Tax=Pichia californica TaxID=460514 RepID=A0A9P6WLK1_9ASCO|nr:hypothetical protein C6P42_001556 [[Candida] californica]KAG0687953.1 hypothetical protein C6P40_001591 [[Candida] californica]
MNFIFNNQDFKRSGHLKEVISRICTNPADYAILIPSTMFLTFNVDKDSGKPLSELCKELDFILSHIIRLDVSKELRIRTHKEFTTLNNKTVTIKADKITSIKNFKYPVSVDIINQELIRGFADYIPIGTCFHVVYITGCMFGNYKFMGNMKNMLITSEDNFTELNKNKKKSLLLRNESKILKTIKPFESMIVECPKLVELAEKFRIMFSETNFKKCKDMNSLETSFNDIMKRGSAMLNSMDQDIFNTLLQKYATDELRESIYNYLEMNIYDKYWSKFIKLSIDEDDKRMYIAYEKLKWLSITEIGLHDDIIGDVEILSKYIKKVITAIADDMDADTLVLLLIFVICLSKVSNLNNHLKYIRKYSYSIKNIEEGILGYALSTLEIAIKYFHTGNQLQDLISKSLQNEVLWRLIGAVSSDFSTTSNKDDDERTFKELEKLLAPLNMPNKIIPLDSFVKSRTLEGDSCLMYALKQNNRQLMDVLLQFEYIFTLDDILEDQNINGSNLLAAALSFEHSIATSFAKIISYATEDEIYKYINHSGNNGRAVSHLFYSSYLLIHDFGMCINWVKRDNFGNTPFMVYVRCYDHPNYNELMALTIPTVKQWYINENKLFSFRDHLDSKGNTILHMIRDSITLDLFLKTFKGLELNYLNDSNQSAVSLAVRYNRIDNVEILIKDPRFCLSVVDPVMYMSPLDYVKLERWEEDINRNIAKMLEIQFIWTEYGENLDIACVRARFEPDNGLCCYFRVVNKLGKSDIILVPIASIIKAFKLMKKENVCIPFDFNFPDLWFPKYLNVTMKGNISSSNKIKINALINSINLLIQALYMNGTLEHTNTLQNYLLTPQEPCKIEVQHLDERGSLKNIFAKFSKYRKNILLDKLKFKRMIIKPEDIIAYDAFLEYTMSELGFYSTLYSKLYRTFTLSNEEAKDLDKLRTDVPWIVQDIIKFRECRIEDSSDIFLDKIRLLYASVNELIKVSNDMKSSKLRRWRKLTKDLKGIRSELDRIAGSGVDGSLSPSPYAGPVGDSGSVKAGRKDILAKVFKQIDILTGVSDDDNSCEEFRLDVLKSMFKGKYDDITKNDNDDMDFSTKEGIEKTLEELIDLNDTGIGSWFVEKRRVTYVKRLLETFLKFRIDLVELNLELRRDYENLAVFVSKFYQFRILIIKNAYKNYSTGKIGELKRELNSWELSLREYRNNENSLEK